jgi:voltage-gated sodium channel
MGMISDNAKVSSVCPEEAAQSGKPKAKRGASTDKIKSPVLLQDANKLKDNNSPEDLAEKPYNVEDFYWEKGFWQAIAKNEYFGHLTLGVISFNACWIGIDSDHNDADTLAEAELPFQIGEHFFAVFFTFEWLTRFMSFQSKWNCFKDGWFKFDSALVFLMVAETWVMPLASSGGGGGMGDVSILRLLRLLRLTRMARLMRAVPELMTLLKGMAAAVRSVFSTLVLLILFTYVFAIIFKQQAGANPNLAKYFETIPEAMWNLLLVGTLLDNITDVLNLLREEAPALCAVFLFWVLLSSFTILNMLIGVLCEVVAAVSDAEKENNVVNYVKDTLLGVLDEFDVDKNRKLCESEFAAFCAHPQTKEPLEAIDVDVENLVSLTDVIFAKAQEDEPNPSQGENSPHEPGSATRKRLSKQASEHEGRELDFGEVLETILELRSSNMAMVKDAVEIRKQLRRVHKEDITCFQEMAEDSQSLQQMQSDMIEEVKKLQSRNEEIVNKMILPIAEGVRNIHKQLGLEASDTLTALAGHEDNNGIPADGEELEDVETLADDASPRALR